MPESVDAKARRLLSTDCVQILYADESTVAARVRGDTGVYDVQWERGDWSCTCANLGACSHWLAVKLVTLTSIRHPAPANAW